MNRATIMAVALLTLLGAGAAEAQDRWAVEIRGGMDITTQDVADQDLGNGIGLEGTLRYRLMPHLAVYGGWDWVHFGPETSFAGTDVDFEETGYALGLRWEHPFSGESGGPAYWVRGGMTYDHLELEDANGDALADSGHGVGWEAGAGLTLGLGGRLAATPGVRFRSLSRDVEVGGTTTDVDLRYVAVGVGLAFTF